MKISRNWLQRFFASPLPKAEELAHALTFHAFEIEEVVAVGDDTIIDVKVTPNRGHDCLCHRGIAKELSVILSQPLNDDPLRSDNQLSPQTTALHVEIVDANRCKRFSAALVSSVKVGPSPAWLKAQLEAIGQRSINNIVDATNFVMFNLGQPLHAFDADKLTEKEGKRSIVVRVASSAENITTLDGKQYSLTSEDLLITDGHSKAPLGIAGVKGGKQAEVTSATTNLIIEAANFDRTSVRKTSQRLKLRTDASQRFENEISPELTAYGLQAVVSLILEIANGKVEGYVDLYPIKEPLSEVTVTLEQINGLLGTAIIDEEVQGIFKRFGFVFKADEAAYEVQIPFERLDLTIPEDLIEEVGRIYGYEKIVPITPKPTKAAALNKRFFYAEKIRHFLLKKGFSEVYTSSFRNQGSIELANAVALDKNFLRADLSLGLNDALSKNANNMSLLGLSSINLFEMGTVFNQPGEEIYALGLASWMGDSAKKKTEAAVFIQGVKGELERVLGAPLKGGKDTIFETNLGVVIDSLPEPEGYEFEGHIPENVYRPFSLYPFVLRDIALWVPSAAPQEDVIAVIKKEAGELLVRVDNFDTFEKEGKVSYAFHLVFQSNEKTLSDDEINVLMQKVVSALESQSDWKVR